MLNQCGCLHQRRATRSRQCIAALPFQLRSVCSIAADLGGRIHKARRRDSETIPQFGAPRQQNPFQRRLNVVTEFAKGRGSPTRAPIDADQTFGPKGMLLVGFQRDEADTVLALFDSMPEPFPLAFAHDAMMDQTLRDAMFVTAAPAPAPVDTAARSTLPVDGASVDAPSSSGGGDDGRGEAAADASCVPCGDASLHTGLHAGLHAVRAAEWRPSDTISPRVVMLSGLSGAEQVALAESWEDLVGTPPPIFAAVVPATLGLVTAVLLERIVKEAVSFEEEEARAADSGAGSNNADLEAVRKALKARHRKGAKSGAPAPHHRR